MTVEITYEKAMNAVNMVQQLHDKTGAFFESQGLDPNSNSIAAKELQAFKRPKSLFTAYSQGVSLIDVAADHLIAFTKTITEPAQSIAPWTITRSVLEVSALSSWLLDTKINSHERVQRSLALRYEGLSQQVKFVQSIGQPAEIINKRIEEIELIAEGLGFSKLRNRKDERTGIGQVMPSVTEIIRDTLNEESYYRLYSAMAHSHHWAYSQLSYRVVEELALQKSDTVLVEKHLSLELLWWLCVKVAHYFSQPIKYKCELYGFDLESMDTIISDVFKGIGVRPKNAS
jgi:hypothetical protein